MEKIRMLFLLCVLASLSGCAQTSNRYNSSTVDYLFPERDHIVETAGMAHLQLPIKVGVAFVPNSQEMIRRQPSGWSSGWVSGSRGDVLTESEKINLLEKVSRRFEALDFVHAIEIIPSAYLVPQGSFANLDQIRTMFGIDVIALVAYDQTQFTDEGIASITYWTLVGAYVVPGEKNSTHTMIDTAVYDIKSRTLLFRAPGVSHVKSSATPVNLSEQLRRDRVKAFDMAADDLIVNLEHQLDRFQDSLKQRTTEIQITHRDGYSGGGFTGSLSAALFGMIGVFGLWLTYRRDQ